MTSPPQPFVSGCRPSSSESNKYKQRHGVRAGPSLRIQFHTLPQTKLFFQARDYNPAHHLCLTRSVHIFRMFILSQQNPLNFKFQTVRHVLAAPSRKGTG